MAKIKKDSIIYHILSPLECSTTDVADTSKSRSTSRLSGAPTAHGQLDYSTIAKLALWRAGPLELQYVELSLKTTRLLEGLTG